MKKILITLIMMSVSLTTCAKKTEMVAYCYLKNTEKCLINSCKLFKDVTINYLMLPEMNITGKYDCKIKKIEYQFNFIRIQVNVNPSIKLNIDGKTYDKKLFEYKSDNINYLYFKNNFEFVKLIFNAKQIKYNHQSDKGWITESFSVKPQLRKQLKEISMNKSIPR